MVNNGKNKICGECKVNQAMSHRFHKRYVCHQCSGIPNIPEEREEARLALLDKERDRIVTEALHIFGHGSDLYCEDGSIQDDLYYYRYSAGGRKYDEPYFDPEWECLLYDKCTITHHIYYCKKSKCHDDSDLDLAIVNSFNWEDHRIELLEESKT